MHHLPGKVCVKKEKKLPNILISNKLPMRVQHQIEPQREMAVQRKLDG